MATSEIITSTDDQPNPNPSPVPAPAPQPQPAARLDSSEKSEKLRRKKEKAFVKAHKSNETFGWVVLGASYALEQTMPNPYLKNSTDFTPHHKKRWEACIGLSGATFLFALSLQVLTWSWRLLRYFGYYLDPCHALYLLRFTAVVIGVNTFLRSHLTHMPNNTMYYTLGCPVLAHILYWGSYHYYAAVYRPAQKKKKCAAAAAAGGHQWTAQYDAAAGGHKECAAAAGSHGWTVDSPIWLTRHVCDVLKIRTFLVLDCYIISCNVFFRTFFFVGLHGSVVASAVVFLVSL